MRLPELGRRLATIAVSSPALFGAVSVALFGLLFAIGDSRFGGVVGRQAAYLIMGAAGGAVARRWLDVVAWAIGAAVAWWVCAVVANLGIDAPADVPILLLG